MVLNNSYNGQNITNTYNFDNNNDNDSNTYDNDNNNDNDDYNFALIETQRHF